MKLKEITEFLNIEFNGDENIEITGVSGLKDAKPGELSFLVSDKYQSLLSSTKASAVIVPSKFSQDTGPILLNVDNPDKAFANISILFYDPPPDPLVKVHSSAIIDDTVLIGKNVSIGANCVIEGDVKIGDNAIIGANVVIGYGSQIGSDVHLFPLVSLREYCVIGNRVKIHNGTVIGSDGFGYYLEKDGSRKKIPQIGYVVLEDDVEIGANVTIDRARFGKTVIGRGTKIDNLVQIAHNVKIGNDCILCGQVGIAGTVDIGSNTILAGQVGVTGHLSIGDRVIANACSGITKDVPSGEHVMGMPAVNHKKFNKSYACMLQLSKLREKIRKIELKLNKNNTN